MKNRMHGKFQPRESTSAGGSGAESDAALTSPMKSPTKSISKPTKTTADDDDDYILRSHSILDIIVFICVCNVYCCEY